jgi:hypothetical protein
MFGASSIEQRHVRRRRSMDQSFAFTEHLITQHNSVLHKGRSAATGRSCCCCCCRRFEKLERAAPKSLEIPAPTSSSSKFAGSLKKVFFQQNPSSHHHHYDYTCYKGGYLQYIFHCNVPSYTRLQLDYYKVLERKQKNSHVTECSTLLADHRYWWKLLESCARLYSQQQQQYSS